MNVCRPLLSSESTSAAAAADAAAAAAPASAAAGLSDETKLRFYGLFKQATAGDCPAPAAEASSGAGGVGGAGSADPAAVARAKRDAWLACAGLRRRDAMRRFVELLDARLPGWAAGADLRGGGGGGGAAPRASAR